jgi:hypothetical protein
LSRPALALFAVLVAVLLAVLVGGINVDPRLLVVLARAFATALALEYAEVLRQKTVVNVLPLYHPTDPTVACEVRYVSQVRDFHQIRANALMLLESDPICNRSTKCSESTTNINRLILFEVGDRRVLILFK